MPVKTIKIDRHQIRALSNPKRMSIHTSLRTDGPATAKELAERLDTDETSLYYHLRLLTSLDLIQSRTRPSATKPETLYSVEKRFLVKFDLDNAANLKEHCRSVDQLLKTAGKEHRAASNQMRNDLHEVALIGRNAARINRKTVKELKKKLRELSEWVDANSDPRGDRYSFSFFVVPLVRAKNS